MKRMIYLFWPKKEIPSWLGKFEFCGGDKNKQKAYHKGFGLVIRKGGEFRVWLLYGDFIYLNGGSGNVKVTGGDGGVNLVSFKGLFR